MWYQFLLVASGGALGAVARYSTGILVRLYFTDNWPLATLLVNILGSFGIGLVFVLLERSMVHLDFRSLIVVGFFGAFTTFSTFSLELLHMIERGEGIHAISYGALSLLGCLCGVMLGVYAGRVLS